MSMSRESTSLKKSSGDCLKLAKQWCSIWVKWCYFWTTAFSQCRNTSLVRWETIAHADCLLSR